MAEEYSVNVKVILYREEGKPPVIRQVLVQQNGNEWPASEIPDIHMGQSFLIAREDRNYSGSWSIELSLTNY